MSHCHFPAGPHVWPFPHGYSRFSPPDSGCLGAPQLGKDCGMGGFVLMAFVYTLPSTPVPNKAIWGKSLSEMDPRSKGTGRQELSCFSLKSRVVLKLHTGRVERAPSAHQRSLLSAKPHHLFKTLSRSQQVQHAATNLDSGKQIGRKNGPPPRAAQVEKQKQGPRGALENQWGLCFLPHSPWPKTQPCL